MASRARKLPTQMQRFAHVQPLFRRRLLLGVAGGRLTATDAAQRHPITYHEDFNVNPIAEGHRFPMQKDALLFRRLCELGLGQPFTPVAPDVDTLCLAHSRDYVDSFLDGSISPAAMREIGLPWSPALVRRTLIGVGSAVLTARLALQFGVACMCNGGTHHAHWDRGSGWCIFNDLAVAARAAQRDAGVGQVLFVDLDTHQGDGTATIFAGDSSVFTWSVHCEAQGFPHRLAQSDLDTPLPAGTGDAAYLQVVGEVLPRLLAEVRPELVLYNAGVDVHAADRLGKLALSDEGVLARDRLVMRACADAGVPVAAAIGGGYGVHAELVERHVSLHRAAAEVLPQQLRNVMARRSRSRSPVASP